MDRNYCLLVSIVNMSSSDTESCKMLFTWKKKSMFKKKGGRVLSTNTCAHNILYYSHKIDILFPQHIILFPPHIILFPQTMVHDLRQAHKNGAWLSKFCEFMPMQAPHHRQWANKIPKGTRKYRALVYIYVWKLNQTVLELNFRAVKFLFFPRRIWTHTIVALQHLSLNLMSSALDHSTTYTP